jgi:hypothetical protein
MGLRWDPVSHAWHGKIPVDQGSRLVRELGLRPQIVPTIEAFGVPAARQTASAAPKPPTRPPVPPRPHDGSRTSAEARGAFPGADPDEDGVDSRGFSLREITSGLPDDSREADERAAASQLRDVRARVKAARAVVSTTPGLAETLQRDWQKAARFYGRFGITEGQYRHGVSVPLIATAGPDLEKRPERSDRSTDLVWRREATLPAPH